jgi:hypothetical protein
MEMERNLKKVIALARNYYSMKRSEVPLIEVLSNGKNRILREIPID